MEGMLDSIETAEDAVALDQDSPMLEAPVAMEALMNASEQLFDPSQSTELAAPQNTETQDANEDNEDQDGNSSGSNASAEVHQMDVDGLQEDDADELQEDPELEVNPWTTIEPQGHPIEVVLTPPPDPEAYERLSPSFVVDRVLDEIRIGDQTWYSVEYSDGRIDQVSLYHIPLLEVLILPNYHLAVNTISTPPIV